MSRKPTDDIFELLTKRDFRSESPSEKAKEVTKKDVEPRKKKTNFFIKGENVDFIENLYLRLRQQRGDGEVTKGQIVDFLIEYFQMSLKKDPLIFHNFYASERRVDV